MRELNLQLSQGPQPLYLRLAESLRHAIETGQVEPGELLPSTRQLAQLCQAHRHTVMNALGELVSEGWLEAEPARGYRVVAGLPRYFSHDKVPQSSQAGPKNQHRYAFPSGQPELRLFPTQEYYGILREVLRQSDPAALLDYGDPYGCEELLWQLGHYLRRMRDISSSQIVVTHGSQEGIFLVARHLVQPGQPVAVEELGYSPAWEAIQLVGGNLVGLPVDTQGLQPDALEKLAQQGPVAMLYVTPLHQYPTTVTMGQERRRQLYEVATRHRIPILEDDYDHEFHYRSRPLAPLKSRDPEQLVYYVSTFSKVVYPSARLGFVVPPSGQGEALARLKGVTSRHCNSLLQLAQARWMESGGFERHLRRMRRLYHGRLQTMERVLRSTGQVQFQSPDGGMSLWANFFVDSQLLSAAASLRGVAVRPGADYDLHKRSSTHLRLGFASSDEQEIEQGIGLLLEASETLPKR